MCLWVETRRLTKICVGSSMRSTSFGRPSTVDNRQFPTIRNKDERLSDFNALAPPSLTESVANALRNRITAGQLKPGERLVEADLAARMQISRAPVREALRQLEFEGLVTGRPRRGYVVRELHPAELIEIYDLRVLVEPVLARAAAARIGDDDLRCLQAIVDRMRKAVQDDRSMDIVLGDREFHAEIGRISRRPLTAQIFEHFSEQVRRFTALMMTSYTNLQFMVDEHDVLIAALASGDPERAAREMQAHLEDARQRLTVILGDRAGDASAPLFHLEPDLTMERPWGALAPSLADGNDDLFRVERERDVTSRSF